MNQQESNSIQLEYRNFIIEKKHPCVMANTVFAMNNYNLKIYDDITSDEIILPILSDIEHYLNNYNYESNEFESLIICFKNNKFTSELQFEKAMWNFLQQLHDHDNKAWDSSVSQDPNNPNFSFSIKGKAFYIIGMHPESSRIARKAPYCTMVFNLHWQFEKLREMGIYQTVKKRIRSRDEELQGFINPVLSDFGSETETKQYSGREVSKDWKCPFHPKN
ncbi:guanitoxin biosynthesis heme-dependent pre-guanitoxin N-hydroxylase GntA [Mariniflexile litorale]|uniref:Guanitoxin biosynthesis heme-dependent pre-guanitoxin N-hydroxylase GntA n=1 Tax=Mariniflexile litorale TaxID=3045158 RepID=A0AAU7EFK3_9FLAO|nr:guanitoxin biosynthesis heme-dependent pre-guanitoxin N-hydroxylase GntA [Mariniflexile sp. KMM 9835]MDQ8211752.1 guanitoxin biosynthesis heme-dependent pre-guanitoxin N-hydroxylase GntA [Mariniflexile sp. KMM 9835]